MLFIQVASYASAFSPDGNFIATGSWDNTVRLWDKDGNPMGRQFREHRSWISAIRFSHDGKSIISGNADQTMRAWQAGYQQDWLKKACNQLQNHSLFRNRKDTMQKETAAAIDTCQNSALLRMN
ncbi:MAG: hypothetical protein NHB32_09815 [Fischerella sp. CENA71]|nr:hypothetical protein [Fischerella sp. CENA71]